MEGGGGDMQQNAGGCYIIGKISNKITFMPNPRMSGAASAFVEVPPLVHIEILPHCFRTSILFFPDRNGNLPEGIEFKIKGTRTMQMESTFIPPAGDLMPSQNVYTSPRVRRVRPPLYFSLSFDFPAPVSVLAAADDDNVLAASHVPTGGFRFDVPRPGGEVDLSPYPFVRTDGW